MESFFLLRISLNALHSPRNWSLYSQSSGNWYLNRSSVFSPPAQSSIIGPHVLVFRLRSCTNVMNVTAAAVDELDGANTCKHVRMGSAQIQYTRRTSIAILNTEIGGGGERT